MDKKITFTGGEPDLNIDDILRNSTADREALFGLVKGLSSRDIIVSGAEVTLHPLVDAAVSAGYVYLNGEVLQVDAQTVTETQGTDLWEFQKVVTYDSAGAKTFNDSIARQTWQRNRGVLVNVTTIAGMDAVNSDKLDDLQNRVSVNEEDINTLNYNSGALTVAITAGGVVLENYIQQRGLVVSCRVRLNTTGWTGSALGSLPVGITPPNENINFSCAVGDGTFSEVGVSTNGNIIGSGISEKSYLGINFTYVVG